MYCNEQEIKITLGLQVSTQFSMESKNLSFSSSKYVFPTFTYFGCSTMFQLDKLISLRNLLFWK